MAALRSPGSANSKIDRQAHRLGLLTRIQIFPRLALLNLSY